MTIQEVIATVKTINEVYEAEQAKREAEIDALIDESVATLDAYYDDVRKKEKTISNRIAALNELLTTNGNQSAQAQKNYTLAVVKNDNAKMKSLQEQLRKLAEEKLSITAQIEALQLVNVKGDKTLYDAAIKAKDNLINANDMLTAFSKEVYHNTFGLGALCEKTKDAASRRSGVNWIGNTSKKRDELHAHFTQSDIRTPEPAPEVVAPVSDGNTMFTTIHRLYD